jgi:beta-N-acetylhexosaminidase
MQKNLLGRLMLDLDSHSLTDEEKHILQNPQVGGVILFSRNIFSSNQVISLCREIKDINPRLLIAVDQEGGRIQRLAEGYTSLPSMQRLGQYVSQNRKAGIELANHLGWLMASEVIASGLDISFAPVLDLDHETSSIIGDRSLGEIPDEVIAIASAYIAGMNEAGMQAIGKHFPGHGGIQADTHLSYSEDHRSLAELEQHDLLPFSLLQNKLGGIMTAHVSFPEIDSDIPTFSKFWLQEILRQKIEFTGVIFSDDLTMKGTDFLGDIVIKTRQALQSGCTMVLICNDRTGANQALDFMLKNNISQSARLPLLKASKTVSWEDLASDPRRHHILDEINNLNLKAL